MTQEVGYNLKQLETHGLEAKVDCSLFITDVKYWLVLYVT